MEINELISINPMIIRSNQTAIEVARLFIEQNIDGVQVVNDEGKPLGFITRTHLLHLIAQEMPLSTPVEELLRNDFKRIHLIYNPPEAESGQFSDTNDKLPPAKTLAPKQFIVHSGCMKELTKMAIRVAKVDSTVLIQGESGVGKELIADVIHSHGARSKGPLIKINCGAIPENLLESEFFGYEPGAFSGASRKGKIGLFELANGGILFLDEIGDMPLNLQVKLLRVLQDKEIIRVGGIRPIKVDIRIITGTNRNLTEMINNRQFRQDLYYRLNVVPIHVPALRERREDIPVLTNYFLEYFNHKYLASGTHKKLAPEVVDCFMKHDWPGNVRELENLIERLIVTTAQSYISMSDLPPWLDKSKTNNTGSSENISLRCAVEDTERKLLQYAFSRYKSTYEVARVLEINQSTVVRKAAKYGITRSLTRPNDQSAGTDFFPFKH
ncbi:MAG: sigma 54-interacting transcriptional regulator [Syntrophomonadaceae bacterium]|nr:sigma 54-interacting transcriptional regulator [Syntrophomonadaceae bacterium]